MGGMPNTMEGHVALITGASRGIGQAIAGRFAAEGADVALVGRGPDRRSTHLSGALEETEQLARSMNGGRVHVVHADIADPDADKSLIIDDVARAHGRAPDILVHVAAAPREFGDGKPLVKFADTPREWFQRTVDVNVWALWDFARAVVPTMRERGAGWILTISSRQAAPRPSPVGGREPARLGGACLYGGTKAFLDRITTGAAEELYADNIAVNALSPTGPVKTPLSATVTPGLRDEDWEPMETMVEAAVALCNGDPQQLTSRVAYSIPLLVELARPVYTLDGKQLYDGWQPDRADDRWAGAAYLSGH
jgi:NAD(P)-dependent dehydrogenase (short-subunit alcohol dehydrogenase family)